KIFVGGISWATTEDGLKFYFDKFGKVEQVNLMKDRHTGQPRGFAFVKFEDKSVIDSVLQAEAHSIDGRNVDVKRAVPRDQAPARGANSSKPVEALKIFVGGLAPTVNEADFKEYFSKFGEVTDAVVMIDRKTSRSRGFGFITFKTEQSVKDALKETHLIHDKAVEIAKPSPHDNLAAKGATPRGYPATATAVGVGAMGAAGGYGYGGYGYGYGGYGYGGGYGGHGGYGGQGYGYGGYGGQQAGYEGYGYAAAAAAAAAGPGGQAPGYGGQGYGAGHPAGGGSGGAHHP
ncbi:unnamed protein product, partial [Heterosigma akashiwo]